jgi:hypothetical protein
MGCPCARDIHIAFMRAYTGVAFHCRVRLRVFRGDGRPGSDATRDPSPGLTPGVPDSPEIFGDTRDAGCVKTPERFHPARLAATTRWTATGLDRAPPASVWHVNAPIFAFSSVSEPHDMTCGPFSSAPSATRTRFLYQCGPRTSVVVIVWSGPTFVPPSVLAAGYDVGARAHGPLGEAIVPHVHKPAARCGRKADVERRGAEVRRCERCEVVPKGWLGVFEFDQFL